MNKLACAAGALLILIGLLGYFGQTVAPDVEIGANGNTAAEAGADEHPQSAKQGRSFTALIPALFGVGLFGCGVLAFQESMRKHAMHAAAGIALLGGLAGLGRGVPALIGLINGDPDVNRRSMIYLWLMVAVCVAFVFAAVNSFVAARKAREASDSPAK